MAKKTTGKNTQAAYKSEGRYARNKKARIERHLKKHPNDAQSKDSIKSIGKYSRDKPMNPNTWSPDNIKMAQLYKSVGIKGNMVFKKAEK
mgnify:CR=1 FL=1